MNNQNIKVERENFEKNGKNYFSYFIKGKVRNRDIRVQIIPPDKGGYAVLDVVFGDASETELVVTPFEIKDESGKRITGNTFKVRSVDENGDIYECPVKPARSSDKSFLNMLLR